MSRKRVAIIGAGASGLAAIKSCLEEGHLPVCYERDDGIGGLWSYSATAKPGKGGTYKSCVINTSKEMMAYSDFPVPDHFPPFMPHAKVLEYLKLYAKNFDLESYIQFKISVESIRPYRDYEETGKWKLDIRLMDHPQADVNCEVFDAVMVCTGHHVYPHRPQFAGLQQFAGIKLHSKEYKTPDDFKDKTVLIVGVGNSAADIAVDVSRVTKKVLMSSRRGAWIVSRMGPFGYPADALANSRLVFSLPRSALQWLVEKMANFRFDHHNYGIKPKHGALEAHPTINDELPYRIMVGAVKIYPHIDHFTESHVIFTDGTSHQIDAVIFATGYNYRYPFLDNDVLKVRNNEVSLYKYVFPPGLKHATLGVIGLVQAIGAVIPIAEIQARWFTKVLKGDAVLPSMSIMNEDIMMKKQNMCKQYIMSQRHTLQSFWIEYMDEIAGQIDARPDVRELFWKDPWLAVRCVLGPCTPAQYRLRGPGAWGGAAGAIRRALGNNVKGMRRRGDVGDRFGCEGVKIVRGEEKDDMRGNGVGGEVGDGVLKNVRGEGKEDLKEWIMVGKENETGEQGVKEGMHWEEGANCPVKNKEPGVEGVKEARTVTNEGKVEGNKMAVTARKENGTCVGTKEMEEDLTIPSQNSECKNFEETIRPLCNNMNGTVSMETTSNGLQMTKEMSIKEAFRKERTDICLDWMASFLSFLPVIAVLMAGIMALFL